MIIATGSVDINEATKLAQEASNSAGDLADKIKNLKTSLDVTITESTSTPFDDGKEHNDGDMWLVMSGDVATSMYIYSGGSWAAKKWDVNSLSVKNLSALSANLGNVSAGNVNGVNISGSAISGGTIGGATISGGSISIGSDSKVHFYVDDNGLAVGFAGNYLRIGPGNQYMTTITGNGLFVNGGINVQGFSGFTSDVETNGAFVGPTFRINGSTYLGNSEGAVRFVNSTSGSGYIPVYASSFVKSSQLSEKYNIEDISTFEGLALTNGMNIKKFAYKKSDNSQADNIGPIIDNENEIGKKQYSMPSELLSKNEDGISIDTEIGLAVLAIQELTKRNTDLNLRLFKLEKEINANG